MTCGDIVEVTATASVPVMDLLASLNAQRKRKKEDQRMRSHRNEASRGSRCPAVSQVVQAEVECQSESSEMESSCDHLGPTTYSREHNRLLEIDFSHREREILGRAS